MKFLNYNISDDRWENIVQLKNVFLILLIILDLFFILIIALNNVSYDLLNCIALFDLGLCILLFIQLCNDYKNYDGTVISFLKEHTIDIMAVIPFNFIFLRYLAVFRFARLIQVLQIFKVLYISDVAKGSFKYFIHNRLLKVLVIILFMYLLFSSVTLSEIDPSFASVFDAFWFNMVTISSVGYGDLTPLTDSGKIISIVSIIIGLVFVSIFTAAMSAVYMEKPEEETRTAVKKSIEKYVDHSKKERDMLNKRIVELEKNNKQLNEKLDRVLELLDEEDE